MLGKELKAKLELADDDKTVVVEMEGPDDWGWGPIFLSIVRATIVANHLVLTVE